MQIKSHKTMVAFCDVLGYKDLVLGSSMEELVDHHLTNLETLRKSSAKDYPSDEAPTRKQVFQEARVGKFWFSDSIIFYSLHEDVCDYENVIIAAHRLLAKPMFRPEYKYRIGIALGEFFCDTEANVYAGKALVEAYELEQKQQWSGAVLTGKASDALRKTTKLEDYKRKARQAVEKLGQEALSSISDLELDDNDSELSINISELLIKYDVPWKHPRKGTEPDRLHAINWTAKSDHPINTTPHNWMPRLEDFDDSVEEKIRNTEKFHFDVCTRCKAVRENF